MPGSQTSRTIKSTAAAGQTLEALFAARNRVDAVSFVAQAPVSAVRTPGSSSTIRIVGFIVVPSWDRRSSARQFDCKPGPARRVVADVDVAAVLRDDPAHDRQTEAAAPSFRRVIRQEEFSRSPGGIPGPSSATMRRTSCWRDRRCVSMTIRPCRSMASTALSTRLMITRRICSESRRTNGTSAANRRSSTTSAKMPLYRSACRR